MEFAKLRCISFLNRFGSLPRARRAFAGVAPEPMFGRPLFGANMALDVSRSEVQQLLVAEGERFVDERKLLRRLLGPGMTVVDVGANIGYYLLLFEQAVGSTGKVVCSEPSVENLPELRANIEGNGFGNVVLHEVALGAEDGEVRLRSGVNSGVVEGRAGGEYTVPLRRLDSLVDERVDLLKIDVEGYEGQVLSGATALLEKYRPILFLELHPHIVGRFGYSVRGILDGLTPHYRDITLYEKTELANRSLLTKIAVRYLGRDALSRIQNPDAYVEQYDRSQVSHTYWAVCKP